MNTNTCASSMEIRGLVLLSCLCLLALTVVAPTSQAEHTDPDTGKAALDAPTAPDSASMTADSASAEQHVLLAEVHCSDVRKPRYDYFSYTVPADSSGERALLLFSLAVQGDLLSTRGTCIKSYADFGNPARVVPFSEAGMNGSFLLVIRDADGSRWSGLPDYVGAVSDPQIDDILGITGVDWDAAGYISAIHVSRPMGENENMGDYASSTAAKSVRCYRIP
jgi:hypothetical protein